MASSSSNLAKMQKAMDHILAVHGKDLHDRIHTFPAKAHDHKFHQQCAKCLKCVRVAESNKKTMS